MKSKNAEVLRDFVDYCTNHPSQRFWQALRNWSGSSFIISAGNLEFHSHDELKYTNIEDTFYWEGK